METINKIEIHEKLIEILEAVQYFESKIYEERFSQLYNYQNFPSLKIKSKKKIEIYNMCIERVNARYEKLLKTL